MFAPKVARPASLAAVGAKKPPALRSALAAEPANARLRQPHYASGGRATSGHGASGDSGEEGAAGGRWGDFGRIPVFAEDGTGGSPFFSFAAPFGALQPKLVVGSKDDPLEFEADQIALRVMRTGENRAAAPVALHSNPSRTRRRGDADVNPATEIKSTVQRSAVGPAQAGPAPAAVHEVIRSPGQPLSSSTRAFFEPRFGHNFSRIRVHDDARSAESARSIDASAYTVGQHIAFGAGSYEPSSEQGRTLLAHELAHTLQQGGDADGLHTLRRRRIPDSTNLNAVLPAAGTDEAEHEAGLVRLLHAAFDELKAAEQMQVRTEAAAFGISAPTEAALFAALTAGSRDQKLKFAAAIQKADPTAVLGDPALIDTGPRPGTADSANIATLVGGADKIFDAVAAGSNDSDITDIFGAANVKAAKAKFAKGRKAMHALQTSNHIVTDRSGYNAEVSLGGLTNSSQISLAPNAIDQPTDDESVATMVHESMHAGNASVTDLGYIGTNSFTTMTAADKLNNAADYEVIANRILTPADPDAYAGVTFVPAGTSSGGKKQPKLTPLQAAMRKASETYRHAWTAGLNLHSLFVREYKNPTEWNTLILQKEFGVWAHFSQSLPYWSKVENMTIHHRAGIDATAGSADKSPVTQIDVAQSENVIRQLAKGMDAATLTEAEATALEAKASAAQAAEIAKGSDQASRVLVSLVRSEKLSEITGPVERDERAIARLAKADQASDFFGDVLAPKSPSTFKD